MWISPNHPDPPRPAVAPEPTGCTLTTLCRGDNEELRVALAEYRGHPYISLRVWQRGTDGQWWPCKGKGVSIRMRELAELADVLAEASAEADQGE